MEKMIDEKKLEKMADVQHEIWSYWMKYLFTQGYDNLDGTFRIKRCQVERWKEQMEIPYDDLSENEKKSDRQIVIKFICPILNKEAK